MSKIVYLLANVYTEP